MVCAKLVLFALSQFPKPHFSKTSSCVLECFMSHRNALKPTNKSSENNFISQMFNALWFHGMASPTGVNSSVSDFLFAQCVHVGNAQLRRPAGALRMGTVSWPDGECRVERMLGMGRRSQPGAGVFPELERLKRQMCLLRTLSALTNHLSAQPPYQTTKGLFNY